MAEEIHTILIAPEERTIILETLSLPPGIVARFRFAVRSDDLLEVTLGEEDMEIFLTNLGEAMNASEDPEFVEAVNTLTRRNVPDPEGPVVLDIKRDVFPDDMPEEVFESIREHMDGKSFESEEEAFEAMRAFIESHNTLAMGALGGLSPDQLYALLCTEWDDNDTVVVVSPDLTPEDLAESAMACNGLLLLEAVAAEEPVRITQSGNMNRKFLHAFARRTQWPNGEEETFFLYRKQPNETDLMPVHLLRILLEEGGFLKSRKTQLSLTAKGRKTLKAGNIGALQRDLFHTLCGAFNLAYLDGLPEYDSVQETLAASLYLLATAAGDGPVEVDTLAEQVFLPPVLDEIEETGYERHPRFALEFRLLRPLRYFGLIEYQYKPVPKTSFEELHAIKLEPLFHKMFQFNLPEAAAESS